MLSLTTRSIEMPHPLSDYDVNFEMTLYRVSLFFSKLRLGLRLHRGLVWRMKNILLG